MIGMVSLLTVISKQLNMHSILKQLFDAQAVDGISAPENVDNYQHLVVAMDSASLAAMRIQILGSIQDEMPDFSAAQSPTNQWEALQLKDLQSGASLNGDDGLLLSGTDDHRLFEVNTNQIKWVVAKVSSRTAGTVSVLLRASSNY